MSPQNDLLTFQIKETIFLSTDRAGIKEMRELELLPKVEVIENEAGVSIAGCLMLYAKYEAVQEPADKTEGGTKSLVEAMKFTPFRLEQGEPEENLYGAESELTHRIPISISIPVNKIRERDRIFAVINQFDYQLIDSNRLLVEAELKIDGIELLDGEEEMEENNHLADRRDLTGTEPDGEQPERWEFLHVANEQADSDYSPSTLEEIEHKLAMLEKEMTMKEQERTVYPPPFQPYQPQTYTPYPSTETQSSYSPYSPYTQDRNQSTGIPMPEPFLPVYREESTNLQHLQMEPPAETDTPDSRFGDITLIHQQEEGMSSAAFANLPIQEAAGQPRDESAHARETDQASVPATAESVDFAQFAKARENSQEADIETIQETIQEDVQEASQKTMLESVQENSVHENMAQESMPEAQEDASLTAEQEEAMLKLEQADAAEAAEEPEAEAVAAEVEEEEAQPAAAESKEVKVAISSKGARPADEPVNLTNLFTARRNTNQAKPTDTESSSAYSQPAQATAEIGQENLDVVKGLTSFVRDQEERFSRMKMCIIQQNDTLETVASRYAMPVTRLMEVNNLTSDRVTAGQILLIPQ